jgi:hypothetical protein
MATVMGPTPPGTGVMWAATLEAVENSTSPTSRWPDFLLASEIRGQRLEVDVIDVEGL